MILTYIPNSQPQHGIKNPLQICSNLQDKLSVYFAFAHVGTAAQCIIRIINDCQNFLPFAPSKFLILYYYLPSTANSSSTRRLLSFTFLDKK